MRHGLTMAAILVSVLLPVGPGAQEAGRQELFSEIGPIEGADPERRQLRVLKVPTALILESQGAATRVGFDERSASELKLKVGHRMAVGCEWTLYHFREGERVVIRRNLGGSLETLMDGGHVVQGVQEVAETQGSLQLIAELAVFETDIPPQHDWMPRNGRYRVLWRGVATGVLTTD